MGKTKFLFFMVLLGILNFFLAAESVNQLQDHKVIFVGVGDTSSTAGCAITTGDYCEFLNKNASSDEQHLYDDKMAGDLESVSIKRSGMPGSYVYVVASEEEKQSVAFVDYYSARCYCDWKENGEGAGSQESSDSNVDLLLKSNIVRFSIVTPQELTLLRDDNASASKDIWTERIEAITGLVVAVAGAGGLYYKYGNCEMNCCGRPKEDDPEIGNDKKSPNEAKGANLISSENEQLMIKKENPVSVRSPASIESKIGNNGSGNLVGVNIGGNFNQTTHQQPLPAAASVVSNGNNRGGIQMGNIGYIGGNVTQIIK